MTASQTVNVTSKSRPRDQEDERWRERYGKEAAGKIREAVDLCREDYGYLWGFRIEPEEATAGTA